VGVQTLIEIGQEAMRLPEAERATLASRLLDGKVIVKSLAKAGGLVSGVSLLGPTPKLDWAQSDKGLVVMLPGQKPCEHVFALKILGDGLKPTSTPTE